MSFRKANFEKSSTEPIETNFNANQNTTHTPRLFGKGNRVLKYVKPSERKYRKTPVYHSVAGGIQANAIKTNALPY